MWRPIITARIIFTVTFQLYTGALYFSLLLRTVKYVQYSLKMSSRSITPPVHNRENMIEMVGTGDDLPPSWVTSSVNAQPRCARGPDVAPDSVQASTRTVDGANVPKGRNQTNGRQLRSRPKHLTALADGHPTNGMGRFVGRGRNSSDAIMQSRGHYNNKPITVHYHTC